MLSPILNASFWARVCQFKAVKNKAAFVSEGRFEFASIVHHFIYAGGGVVFSSHTTARLRRG